VGHSTQVGEFVDAVARGRVHHAWLLAGPKGVGKRAFADAAALRLLSGEAGGLDVGAEHAAARLVAAGSHMDHRVLMREVDEKGKAAAEIKVDQVRELQPLFRTTPGLGAWRTVIIDAVDDMGRAGANAFLKNLEEPPKQTVFFLVSHAPGRLLPTIRSRCRALRFGALTEAEVAEVLWGRLPEAEAGEIASLVEVADGSPGEALRYVEADLQRLGHQVDAVMAGGDRAEFARSFAAIAAAARFDGLMAMAPRRLAEAARVAPGEVTLRLYARGADLCAGAVKLAYERSQVAFEVATLLAEAGKRLGKVK